MSSDASGETRSFETGPIVGELEVHDYGITVDEQFERNGEAITRETELSLNRDGSVTVSQRDQTREVVTLSEPVVACLCEVFEAGEIPVDAEMERSTD